MNIFVRKISQIRDFKRIFIAFMSVLMAVTMQLKADDNCNTSTCCEPIPCCDPEPCCKSICCDTYKSWIGLKADLLYWRSELSNLESLVGESTNIFDDGMNTFINDLNRLDFKWRSGFRIGADVSFNCFNLEADWTHYNGLAKVNREFADGKWNIKYNAIDLVLGRRFAIEPCFHLKPFIGVRGIKIHQSLVGSRIQTNITFGVTTFTTTNINVKDRAWGIGPQIGLEGDWYLRYNLSLYGSLSAVSYYGNIKDNQISDGAGSLVIARKSCFNNIGTDAALGLRWDKIWCHCNYETKFMIKLGLEQHRIYNFNSISSGNLTFDGGILEAGVSFRY